VEIYFYSLNTPSWHGAQLNNRTGTTLLLPLPIRLFCLGFIMAFLSSSMRIVLDAENSQVHFTFSFNVISSIQV
jgi:hypothetical protein